MDAKSAKTTSKACLKEICDRLKLAAGIAKAAQTRAEACNLEKAVEIALDVEQPICEMNTFLNAASLMNRLPKG
jgi:hypothetical protein